jgi:hypothetical protein
MCFTSGSNSYVNDTGEHSVKIAPLTKQIGLTQSAPDGKGNPFRRHGLWRTRTAGSTDRASRSQMAVCLK